MTLYDLSGTRVHLSASSYSVTSFLIVLSLLLISILLAALVHTLALPVKASNTLWCMHKSVRIFNFLSPHWSTRLMPFSSVSNSTRLRCVALFIGRNQHTSLIAAPSFSNMTPITKELAST